MDSTKSTPSKKSMDPSKSNASNLAIHEVKSVTSTAINNSSQGPPHQQVVPSVSVMSNKTIVHFATSTYTAPEGNMKSIASHRMDASESYDSPKPIIDMTAKSSEAIQATRSPALHRIIGPSQSNMSQRPESSVSKESILMEATFSNTSNKPADDNILTVFKRNGEKVPSNPAVLTKPADATKSTLSGKSTDGK